MLSSGCLAGASLISGEGGGGREPGNGKLARSLGEHLRKSWGGSEIHWLHEELETGIYGTLSQKKHIVVHVCNEFKTGLSYTGQFLSQNKTKQNKKHTIKVGRKIQIN